jgi:hypothetical protein
MTSAPQSVPPEGTWYTYNPDKKDCEKFADGEYKTYDACMQANYPFDCFNSTTGCTRGQGGRFATLDECRRHADCSAGYQYDPSTATPAPCKHVDLGIGTGPKFATLEACHDATPGYVCDFTYTKNAEGCRYITGPSPRGAGLPKYKRVEDCRCWGAGGQAYWGDQVYDGRCNNVYSGVATSLVLPYDSKMLFHTEAECRAGWDEAVASIANNGNPWKFWHGAMFKCEGDPNTSWKYYTPQNVRRGFSNRAFFDSWGGKNSSRVAPVDCTGLPQGPVMTPNMYALYSKTCPKVGDQYFGCGPSTNPDFTYNCCDPSRYKCSNYPYATLC